MRDTGVGISRKAVQRIFEPFEQETTADSRGFEGIGLGLSVSREVVRRHGGDIRVRSAVGKGSTFTVSLPIRLPGTLQTAASFVNKGDSRAGFIDDDDEEDDDDDDDYDDEKNDAEDEDGEGDEHEDVEVFDMSEPLSKEKAQRTKALVLSPFGGSMVRSRSKNRVPLLLSVDDDAVNQEVVEASLGDEYEVVRAMNGFECLAYFRNK